MTGFSSSTTVTVNDSSWVLPAASVAVYVTVVVPTGNALPEAMSGLNELKEQLSLAEGADHVTTAPHSPASTLWLVMLAGMLEIEGSSSSTTVTVKLRVAERPWAS